MKKLLLCTLLFSSCVQSYRPDPVRMAQANEWKAPDTLSTTGPPCPEPEAAVADQTFRPWWKIFNDPVLCDLEEQAMRNSPSVQAAIARLEQAYAFYGIELSALFPEIDLQMHASRQRLSKTQNLGAAQSFLNSGTSSPFSSGLMPRSMSSESHAAVNLPAPIVLPLPTCNCPAPPVPKMPKIPKPAKPPKPKKPSLYVNELAILPTLHYELDFWGKNWQAAQAAKEQMKAEQEDVQTALLVLTTAVADTYLQVRTYDAEIDVLEKTVKTRKNNFNINFEQYDAGFIDKLPVEEARTDLENARASIQEVKRLRANAEHALAELVGEPAAIFTLEKELRLPKLPDIPAGIPSQVLKRRPDIRQQEYLIESARLNVGVAKTEYFPDFTITANYGFMSSKANKLFKWKSRTWLLAADVITPIFTAGRISSTIKQAIGQYKEQVANYINTVLVSFKEVEDAIYSVYYTKKQLEHLDAVVEAANQSYQIALDRYNAGLENYIVVVNNERTYLDAMRQALQVKRAEYSSTVTLIKSLGGCWD